MVDLEHDTVEHSAGEYVRSPVPSSSVESVWAILKRSIYGTWHHVSTKHQPRCADEAVFRLNEGDCPVPTLDRIDSFAHSVFQHRITDRALTA